MKAQHVDARRASASTQHYQMGKWIFYDGRPLPHQPDELKNWKDASGETKHFSAVLNDFAFVRIAFLPVGY